MSKSIPGYRIRKKIGQGGMATVYLAEQEKFEREVALKVMSRSLAEDATFGKRFMQEAKIVSRLVHPNIVTVYDMGQHEGRYFMAMEYIEGKDLRLLRKSLELKQKINAVRDTARALSYAGGKGYVHRDIKPENVMVSALDGRAILTDFGIARATESEISMTQTGVAIGTPHYMSPEQAKGLNVDYRSDLYSLGVVFFYLLTGRVPFEGESAVAIGIKHITESVPLLPEGMEAIQPIIDTLMAKQPDERYQNAEELISDLEDLNVQVIEHHLLAASEKALGVDGYDDDAETAESDSASMDTQGVKAAVAAEYGAFNDRRSNSNNFTISYEHDFDEKKGINPWLWFVVFMCVAGASLGFYGYKNPEKMKAFWQQILSVGDGASQEMSEYVNEMQDAIHRQSEQNKMPEKKQNKASDRRN